MLSVTLGHLESTRVLLQHDTNVNVINRGGWTVVQEAVATGDPELLQVRRDGRGSRGDRGRSRRERQVTSANFMLSHYTT